MYILYTTWKGSMAIATPISLGLSWPRILCSPRDLGSGELAIDPLKPRCIYPSCDGKRKSEQTQPNQTTVFLIYPKQAIIPNPEEKNNTFLKEENLSKPNPGMISLAKTGEFSTKCR